MSIKEFHISIGKELLATKNRVRNLVAHWGEDGRNKEVVLKTVLKRFLPANLDIGTGFVVTHVENNDTPLPSTQIDLIIYDNSFPVLFKESDFVIITPDAVRGIIEVKSNIKKSSQLEEIVAKANKNGQFIYNNKADNSLPFFNGIFSFEGFEKITKKNLSKISVPVINSNKEIEAELTSKDYRVNIVCFNKDIYLLYWGDKTYTKYENEELYCVNKVPDLAFSYFITNLILMVTNNDNRKSVNSELWFPEIRKIDLLGRF